MQNMQDRNGTLRCWTVLSGALLTLAFMEGLGADFQLQNDQVQVKIRSEHIYQETYLAKDSQGYKPVAQSSSLRAVVFENDRPVNVSPRIQGISQEGDDSIRVEMDLGTIRVKRHIQLLSEYPYVQIENTALFSNTGSRVAKLIDTIVFLSSDPDFIWSQNLKWEENDVFPHWAFKFPAMIVQENSTFCALAADIDSIDSKTLAKAPLAFDLAVQEEGKALLTYGLIANQLTRRHHVQYEFTQASAPLLQDTTLKWAYHLALSADEEVQSGFRRLVRFFWKRYGHVRFLNSEDAQKGTDDKAHLCLFDDWRNEAWNEFGPEVYHSWERGGRTVGGYSTFWIRDPNVWFDSWFNSVRTAYGEYLYGKQTNDKEAIRRAMSVVDLILQAPRPGGTLPAIYINQSGDDVWAFDNRVREPLVITISHMFDMSWTGYWLLRFHRDLLPQEDRILGVCRDLGDFFLTKQASSGVLPSWYDGDLNPLPELKETNGETGGAALFLSELFATTGETQYLTGAKRAADYVWREIVPTRKWFDFEAFRSCSRKPFDFYDKWTRQYPANHLCILRSAQAYFSLYEVTNEDHYLEKALWVTDFSLLGQQPWSHPLFRGNVFGGFTAQNSDYEWSDARQVYAAEMLFKAYQHTGTLEYLERAVAAMRANFKVSPLENWAHDGQTNAPTGRPKFHWGTGSGAATVEMFSAQYGDAYVHLERNHGSGIDGCTLRKLDLTGFSEESVHTIEIQIDSPFIWKRKASLVLDGLEPAATYEVLVNGERFSGLRGNGKDRTNLKFTMRVR